jgi:hypothetical protein
MKGCSAACKLLSSELCAYSVMTGLGRAAEDDGARRAAPAPCSMTAIVQSPTADSPS